MAARKTTTTSTRSTARNAVKGSFPLAQAAIKNPTATGRALKTGVTRGVTQAVKSPLMSGIKNAATNPSTRKAITGAVKREVKQAVRSPLAEGIKNAARGKRK